MRRDDDVEIPSLSLDHDDLRERRTSQQKSPKLKLTPPPARPNATTASAVPAKRPSLAFVYFLLLLIMGGGSAGGYWMWQQNQLLLAQLKSAQSEIQDLDHQLIAADVSVGEIGDSVDQQIAENKDQIRKLWGVSYDTNRNAIKEINQKLDVLGKELSDTSDAVSTQKKLVSMQGDTFNDIEAGYLRLVESMKVVQDKLIAQDAIIADLQARQEIQATSAQGVQLSLAERDRQIAAVKETIASLQGRADSVETQFAGLANDLDATNAKVDSVNVASAEESASSSDIKELTDAVISMDSFRAQVLQDIDVLKRQVNQLFLDQSLGQ